MENREIQELRVDVLEGGFEPTVSNPGEDAGVDLYSPYSFTLYPFESAHVDLKVKVQLPPNTKGKIEGRSGLLIKHCVMTLGGVLDEGFEGVIQTRLFNLSKEPFDVNRGDRICQLIISPVVYTKPVIKPFIDRGFKRGEAGIGSTGR